MPCFVRGNHFPVPLVQDRAADGTEDDLIERILEIRCLNQFLVSSGSGQCGFINQIRKVGA